MSDLNFNVFNLI